MTAPLPRFHGRGSPLNPTNRFERLELAPDPDPQTDPGEAVSPRTEFYRDAAGSLINYQDSPDVGFRASINLYRGCEHGCSYCFARPFHEYLGCSSGLDFETKIFVKADGPRLLRDELSSPRWVPQVLAMSGVTDCYQPAERHFRLTRACLEILAEFRNPVAIITKSALVTRDIPVLQELSRHRAARVFVSVTTLDSDLARRMEPRASSPRDRLRAIRELSAAGVSTGVLAAPMIPGLTDHELPAILEAARTAGAAHASYTLLRLPYAVKDIFCAWLDRHEPGKKGRVLARLRELRGGKLYDPAWGARMTGQGLFAEQLSRTFEVVARRLGFDRGEAPLSTGSFRRPGGEQMTLF